MGLAERLIRGVWRRLPLPAGLRGRIVRGVTAGPASRALARLEPPAALDAIAAGPVRVAGLHGAVLGIGASARLQLDALTAAGIAAEPMDLSDLFGRNELGIKAKPTTQQAGGAVVIHLNAPEMLRAMARMPPRALSGVMRIGYWAWELPRAPADWADAFAHLHEVWVPSHYVADALALLNPPIPVRVVPHRLAEATAKPDRSGLALPADGVVFAAVFDMASAMARKNPMGALNAFLAAFPEPGRARLLVKGIRTSLYPAGWQALRAAAGGRPDIVFHDTVLTPERAAALIASIDVLVSLHRSEGFGLVIAEAMRAGKPVIATDWSGSRDFFSGVCGAAVPARLIAVDDPQGIYAPGIDGDGGVKWADPDLGAAAEAMRALMDDARRTAVGAAAARKAADAFDLVRWRESLGARFLAKTRRCDI
jgi:glycosyltransferase involved in cell wall biosynthesis